MVHTDAREAILRAAAATVAERGVDGATTREIYLRAGVKAPTLYHYFGDKRGLMDAVVSDAFDRYLTGKQELQPTGDATADLRRGWDAHVAFAQANPAIYPLMFSPGSGESSAAARQSFGLLRAGFQRLAGEGALRPGISADQAARALSATLRGVAAAVCRDPGDPGNQQMSALVRDAVAGALLRPRR